MSKYGELLIPLALLAVTVTQYIVAKKKQQQESKADSKQEVNTNQKNSSSIMIMYGSCMGTAKNFAYSLSEYLLKQYGIVSIVKDSVDFDDADIEKANYFFLLSSTWTDGKPPMKVERLYDWLLDYATDFRVSKDHLSTVSYAVFGLGAKVYGKNFCKAVSTFYLS